MNGNLQVKLALLGAVLYCLSFGVSRHYLDHKFPASGHRMAIAKTAEIKTPVAFAVSRTIKHEQNGIVSN
ncbi:MAG: hypothetical protein ACHQRM_10320 [Bacteroidia bacterium]